MADPSLKSKNRDFSGLPAAERNLIKENYKSSEKVSRQYSGINCTNLREAVPEYIKADCEKVICNSNNAFIVLGRDRVGAINTGYGGKAHTQAGSIDIVVGRMNPSPKEVYGIPGDVGTEHVMEINPMLTPVIDPESPSGQFQTDAARIYISQKTDIDDNFGLMEGPIGSVPRSYGRSGIAIKADSVRIMGNEGIKIITKPDLYNSLGSIINSIPGIDLIAGDRAQELQPMVLGENMTRCLQSMIKNIYQLNSIVLGLTQQTMQMNIDISEHMHPPAPLGALVAPSMELQINLPAINKILLNKTVESLKNHTGNLTNTTSNYIGSNAPIAIRSRYNKTN
tara:strand:- start:143 stop:1159 length:1017 start_codon:yes stop_codon:yes gene_type:complete